VCSLNENTAWTWYSSICFFNLFFKQLEPTFGVGANVTCIMTLLWIDENTEHYTRLNHSYAYTVLCVSFKFLKQNYPIKEPII